jgi:predicted dehydrogenase
VVGLVRYASGALAQFEAAWTFRGGMDLRDEVSGSEGSIWLNHWLRTGFEMFSAPGSGGYVAEKAEAESGWLFPVGDEPSALGYDDMFADMLDAFDAKRAPVETFYDGYVVNAIMDACYRSIASKRWETVALDEWRGSTETEAARGYVEHDARHWLVKVERMPDGRRKVILKDKETGAITERVE